MTAFCAADPSKRHSRNSVFQFDIKSTGHLKTDSFRMLFYFDLFYRLFNPTEVTLCGWRDVQIQAPTDPFSGRSNPSTSWSILRTFKSKHQLIHSQDVQIQISADPFSGCSNPSTSWSILRTFKSKYQLIHSQDIQIQVPTDPFSGRSNPSTNWSILNNACFEKADSFQHVFFVCLFFVCVFVCCRFFFNRNVKQTITDLLQFYWEATS